MIENRAFISTSLFDAFIIDRRPTAGYNAKRKIWSVVGPDVS
jgi:hypothetical protein